MEPADDRDLLATAYGDGRASERRLAIARATRGFERAFTVAELTDATDGSPGSATVYRAVAAMVRSGFVERVGRRDGHALYLRCDRDGHHHHLVCTGCGAVAPAPCPLGEAALRRAADAGFIVTRHEVSIYGLCPSCLGRGVASGTG